MKKIFLLALSCSFLFSWDGYDYDSGASVEIGKGNLVRKGRDIEIYDHKDGKYKDVEVESIRDRGNRIDVEVYDYSSGEHRTLEMERR